MGYFKKKNKRRGNGGDEPAAKQARTEGRNDGREQTTRVPRELKEGEVREPRKPKKKVACLIGYCGTGYHGMQMNPPHKTIEGDLFSAFCKAGAISKDNWDDPKKSSFIRAARTDKGVHAGGNVVSLKLIIEDPDIVSKINAELPETIRLWGYSRTNKSFECRKMCGSRIYEYMIPSYSFLPPKPSSALKERMIEAAAEKNEPLPADEEGDLFWASVKDKLEAAGIDAEAMRKFDEEEEKEENELKVVETQAKGQDGTAVENENEKIEESIPDEGQEVTKESSIARQIKTIENESRREYRISTDRLERIRQAFAVYHGQHNFHNFTVGKPYNDPSASRYMKSLDVSDPKIINGTEWLSIKIHGQSFMLHQIRKMVAMAALVIRTGCPLDRITEAFGPKRINIPKAPSLGLLLEQPVYDGYNGRLNTFGYDAINFDKYKEEIEEFKMKHIYDKIYSQEAKENVFHGFFAFIDSFRGDPIFDYLTARGITDASQKAEIQMKGDENEVEGDIEG